MATDIERAADLAWSTPFLPQSCGCIYCVRGHLQALLDAGWTLIPPATDDLPEGWERERTASPNIADVTFKGTWVATLGLASDDGSAEGEPPIFASWLADRVTRILAALEEG